MEVDSDEWRSSADMDISTQLYTGRLQLQKVTSTESKQMFSYFFLIIVELFPCIASLSISMGLFMKPYLQILEVYFMFHLLPLKEENKTSN